MKKMKNILLVLIAILGGLSLSRAQSSTPSGSLQKVSQAIEPIAVSACPELIIRTGNKPGMTGKLYHSGVNPKRDSNWFIHSGSGGMLTNEPLPYRPYVVAAPAHWATIPDANWIGAKNDILNNWGVVVYRFNFNAQSISTASIPFLYMKGIADNKLEVYLNEDPGTTWPTTMTPILSNAKIGGFGNNWQAPGSVSTRKHTLFQNGTNSIYFKLQNDGGQTGINFAGTLKLFNLAFTVSDSRCITGEVKVRYNLSSGILFDVNGNPMKHCINGYTVRLVKQSNNSVITSYTIAGNTTKVHHGTFPITLPNYGAVTDNYYLELLDPNNVSMGKKAVNINVPAVTCCPAVKAPVFADTRCTDGKITVSVNLDGVNAPNGIVNLSRYKVRFSEGGQVLSDIVVPNSGTGFFTASIPLQRSNGNGFNLTLSLLDKVSGAIVCEGINVTVPPALCCPSVTSQIITDNRCNGGGVILSYTLTDNSFFQNLSYLNSLPLSIKKGTNTVFSTTLTGLNAATYTDTITLGNNIGGGLSSYELKTSIVNEMGQSCTGKIKVPPAYCCPSIAASIGNDARCEGGGVKVNYSISYPASLNGYKLQFSDGTLFNIGAIGNSGAFNSYHTVTLGQDDVLDLGIALIHPNGTNISTTVKNCSFSLHIPEACCGCVGSFAPITEQKYVLSGWVREKRQVTSTPVFNYGQPSIQVSFKGVSAPVIIGKPSGDIIDGWQRVEKVFDIPAGATEIIIHLVAGNGVDVYFDDIRMHPFDASMATYVFDPETLRMVAELDDRNYATYYEYDEEGALIRVKKETERGIMTIKEHRNNSYKGSKGL